MIGKNLLKSNDILSIIFIISFSLLLIFYVFPFFLIFAISLFKYYHGSYYFYGLKNYFSIIHKAYFKVALFNTLVLTAIRVIFITAFSLFVSILLIPFSEKIKTFFKISFYVPAIISSSVISVIWYYFFQEDGLINYFILHYLNPVLKFLFNSTIQPISWLQNPSSAWIAILITVLLKSPGPSIVILSSAISVIPKSYYEVADMDGATFLQKFRYIILPLIKPALFLVMILNTITSFHIFAEVYVLTDEGPGYSTAFLLTRIYKEAFITGNVGNAAVLSVILFLIISFLVFIESIILKSNEEVEF